jgi:large subunit ribosomal protein L16
VAVVKKGTIMFELINVPQNIAFDALKAASYKLPIKCKIVSKLEEEQEKVN